MVSAVTCAVERITDGNIWFWLEADRCPLFSEGAGTSVHPRKCQRIWKHQSKIEQYYSSRIRRFWVRTGIQIQHPPGSVLGEKQSRKYQRYLKTFSKIMEATSSTACDQGLIKRVHVCWGPALSFFYCTDLCYLNTWEILLMASVNTFYNRFE